MNTATLAEKALQKNKWNLVERQGLQLIESPLLAQQPGLVHAFTTRHGGATPAPYESFNLARHVEDDQLRKDAMSNRSILCNALGLDASELVVPSQRHTTNIYIVEIGTKPPSLLPEYDGIATKSNHPLLLHFADCVPVMIFDTEQQVLSVMHAGWRGTACGIVSKGVQLLISHFGSNAKDIVAAIGPAIGSCCYETGKDVAEKLAHSLKKHNDVFIKNIGEKTYPDLKAINAMQLLEAGVTQVDVSDICTACQPEMFYSHRQSGGTTGRQGALACIRG